VTADEIKAAQLAEQRHTFLDLDPDSEHVCEDPQLCAHGRPIGSAELECPDCRSAQGRDHIFRWGCCASGVVEFCRACGLSSGRHNERGV
jgi:hypothetical protein